MTQMGGVSFVSVASAFFSSIYLLISVPLGRVFFGCYFLLISTSIYNYEVVPPPLNGK